MSAAEGHGTHISEYSGRNGGYYIPCTYLWTSLYARAEYVAGSVSLSSLYSLTLRYVTRHQRKLYAATD